MNCAVLNTTETIKTQIDIFDSVRLSGVRMFLLKRSGQTKKFTSVVELTSGWFVLFDREFRDEIKLMYATLDGNFGDVLAQASFLAFGSGTVLDVYSFDGKDPIPPNATSPSWRIDATREAKERFTIS